jgi:hypothetical protein
MVPNPHLAKYERVRALIQELVDESPRFSPEEAALCDLQRALTVARRAALSRDVD